MSEKPRPFDDLISLVATLRAPGGCMWDIAQTHRTIKHNVVEEACEVVDAIDAEDPDHLKEELGDLLLQVVFHSQMAAEEGAFDIDDVVTGIAEKLRRRHPHVFGDVQVADQEQILKNWEAIKAGEKERPSHLHGVPRSLPALFMAQKLQDRASGVGFDWPDASGVLEKISEEVAELKDAGGDQGETESEFGDVLFALVNLARHLDIQAEFALRAACARFRDRFVKMEQLSSGKGKKMADMSLDELEDLWQQSKQSLREAQ